MIPVPAIPNYFRSKPSVPPSDSSTTSNGSGELSTDAAAGDTSVSKAPAPSPSTLAPASLAKLTKPAPPPPKFKLGHKQLPTPTRPTQSPHQLEHYKMPMRSEYLPEWKAILRDCKYPEAVVMLDFETYFDSECSMKKMSTVEYIMDSRFEVLGLSSLKVDSDVNFPDHQTQTAFHAGEDATLSHLKYLQREYGNNLERCVVVAHNASFDGMVLALRFGIHPKFVIDTLGLCRAWNSRTKNDLDHVTKRLGLPPKGDTSEFGELSFHKRFKKPKKGRSKGPKLPIPVPTITDEQVAKLAEYANNDVMREWEVFTIMLPRLSRPAFELRVMQHTLELFWKPVLEVDYERADELIVMMEAEIDKVMSVVGTTREEISGDKSFEWLLCEAVTAADENPQQYFKIGKKGYLLAIAKTDPERELLEKHPSERVRQLMQARIALDSWPTHIGRVQRIVAQCKAAGGKLPVPLKYHGAHTGRWSGGEKINLQNLGSRGHELVNAIREILIAAVGFSLIIVDESQIEARVLAWIAGQWDLVTKFANNEEIYCDFATKVLGYPVRKPKKTGIPAIEAKMKWARNAIGKIGVLGCGYGMGQTRIFEYAGGEVDMDMALKIRDTYRAENPQIVQFWKDIERAFIYTAKYQKACEMPRGLKFHSTPDCDVVLTLPNGREIHYTTVRIVSSERGEKIELWNDQIKTWEHTWGGSLTENVVQAMSRDVLAEAFLRLEDLGYHTALHVHDELVMPTPDDQAEKGLKVAIEELSRRPAWGPELPLGAEGVISKRYGTH